MESIKLRKYATASASAEQNCDRKRVRKIFY